MLPDLQQLHHTSRGLCIRYNTTGGEGGGGGGGGGQVPYFVTMQTMPRMLTYPQKQSHILPDHMAIVGAHVCAHGVWVCMYWNQKICFISGGTY